MIQHFLQRIHRRRRINHHTRQAIVALDEMQRAVQVPASFLMHRNPIRPRLGKRRNKLVRILDHQVAVERQLRHLAQRLHHRRPNRQVRHEMPIHNIHMDDRRATFLRRAHLFAQTGKVRRKNRRCQLNQSGLLEPELS